MKFKSLIFTLLLFTLAALPLRAQEGVELELEFVEGKKDSLQTEKLPPAKKLSRRELKALEASWSDEYLDTVTINKKQVINDYSLLGVQYGVGLSQVLWNPSMSQKMVFMPWNFGIMYSRYGKMFNFMPYFGFQIGVFYTQEAFRLKSKDEENYIPTLTGTGESSARMNVIEVPFLAHCHIDFWKMKILVNAGLYGGYRLSIQRFGDNVKEEYANSFTEYNHRMDFGVKAGAGFAFIFDPVEIHFQAMYKHSLSSLYDPDYTSPYYYRFAYPSNIIISVGLHFQITKRSGKTSRMLRQEAKDMVFGTNINEVQNNENQGDNNR